MAERPIERRGIVLETGMEQDDGFVAGLAEHAEQFEGAARGRADVREPWLPRHRNRGECVRKMLHAAPVSATAPAAMRTTFVTAGRKCNYQAAEGRTASIENRPDPTPNPRD